MLPGRFLRLLFLLLPATLGWAAGVGAQPVDMAAISPQVGPSISAPRQSLPIPVHNEATCGFCQAAIFPPCTPPTVSVPADLFGIVHEVLLSPDARIPYSTARRLASSRAPPTLRIV
ncbi:MAG: hypothetical protein ACREL3_01860 [Gemmatimonadales bacterium]